MSYPRPLPSHLRNTSLAGPSSTNTNASSTQQSPLLLARIAEKQAELSNLKELQALSANLADQMAQLEQKLATLTDGTEAVATVLGNWHNVLRAIGMAAAAIPKPKESAQEDALPLPQTLVRIPMRSNAQNGGDGAT